MAGFPRPLGQRPESFRLNRRSSQARGLLSAGIAGNAGNTIHDIASGSYFGVPINGPSLEIDEFGRVVEFNDDAGNEVIQMDHLAGVLNGLPQVTFFVVAKYIGGAADANEDDLGFQWSDLQGSQDNDARRLLFRYDSFNQELDFFVQIGAASPGGSVSALTINDPSGSNPAGRANHWLACRYDGANLTVWINGINQGTVASTSGSISSAATSKVPELIGGHAATNLTTDGGRFRLSNWGLWNRALSDREMFDLYSPQTRWDLYEPLVARRRYFVAAAPAGGRIMSSLAASGGLAGKGGIAGPGGGLAG